MIEPGRWQFDFSEPLLILLAVVLLFSFLLVLNSVIKRLFKRAHARALAVIALNIIAYASVLLFLLEPRVSRPLEQSITLVTEGTELEDVRYTDSSNLYVAPGVDPSVTTKHLKNASRLLDVGQLQLREPALGEIKLHGYGLDHDQWQAFPGQVQINFNPPQVYGFTAMRWQRSLMEGEILVVTGRYHSPEASAIIELRLLDPADNVVNTTRIKSGQDFSLSAPIKSRGNLEFRLQAWQAGVQLSGQLLAFEAASGVPLNIMIRQSAPSFETRALTNEASANGHRFRVYTDISKDKTLQQTTNLPGDADTGFSPGVLAEQDILIMDGRSLVNLPDTQLGWLQDSIEKGLGLLVLADSTLLERFDDLNTNILKGFQLAPLPRAQAALNPRLLTRGTTDWQQPLQTAAIQLEASDANVLVDDGQGRSLVTSRPNGLGNIAISLIKNTHSWFTSGQNADWGEYWSAIFASLARQRVTSYLLPQAETGFHRVDERAEVCALAVEKNARVLVQSDKPRETQGMFGLQLTADSLNSPLQCAYFWPETSGWHRLQLVSGNSGDILDQKAIYVFKSDQWLAQQRNQRMQATRTMASNSNSQPQEFRAKWVSEPINPFWLWLTLVLSASILWLERKLDIT